VSVLEGWEANAPATFSAFLPQMQFVIVSEAELVDKLREL